MRGDRAMPSVVPSSVCWPKRRRGGAMPRQKTIIGVKLSPNGWKHATHCWRHTPMRRPTCTDFDRDSAIVEGQTTAHSCGPIAVLRQLIVAPWSRHAPRHVPRSGPIASVNIAVSRSRRSVRRCASVRCVAVSPTTVTLTDEGMPAIRSLVGAGANG